MTMSCVDVYDTTTFQTRWDRLIFNKAVRLEMSLPKLIRGFRHEGRDPSRTPDKTIDKTTFPKKMRQAMGGAREGENPVDFAQVGFKLLHHCIAEGEAEDVKQIPLPELEELRPHKMS